MANFEIAESITGRSEGGYANNPADNGGETFAGIARNYWSNWEGWKYIDQYKNQFKTAKTSLSLAEWINASAKVKTEPVGDLVSFFYKNNFWSSLKLDFVNDQQLANSIYDFAVNSGVNRSVKYIQEVVGVKTDGVIGPNTIKAINNSDPEFTLEKFNKKRELFYRSIAKGDQSQFLKSWLSRLKKYQY